MSVFWIEWTYWLENSFQIEKGLFTVLISEKSLRRVRSRTCRKCRILAYQRSANRGSPGNTTMWPFSHHCKSSTLREAAVPITGLQMMMNNCDSDTMIVISHLGRIGQPKPSELLHSLERLPTQILTPIAVRTGHSCLECIPDLRNTQSQTYAVPNNRWLTVQRANSVSII